MSGEESDPAGQRNSPNAGPAASPAAPPSDGPGRESSSEESSESPLMGEAAEAAADGGTAEASAAPELSEAAPAKAATNGADTNATPTAASAQEPPRTGRGVTGPRAWLERLRGLTSTTPEVEHDADLARAPLNVWGIAARSVALGTLLGISLVGWVRFSFDAAWLVEFLVHNRLDMPMRMGLIGAMLGGGAAGALAVGGALYWSFRKQRPVATVEQWLWFLSPLTLAPTLPLLLRFRAWEDKHDDMLPAILFVGLVLELFLYQSLRSVPARALRVWESAKSEMPEWLRRHGPVLVVVLGAALYTVFMSFYTIRWHHKLGTGTYELGINNNLMYGGLSGEFNQSRVAFPDDPAKYITNHVKLGAYAFLPFYALAPRPETLQVIQSAALGFGAIPLFLFSRRWVAPWMAATIALCWLAYYPIHGANFYEVDFVPIASLFVLAAAWAAEAKRWVLLGLACSIGVLLREDMPVGFAVLGAFLLASGHRPKAGLILASVSTLWFVLVRLYILDDAGDWWFPKMYKDLWAEGETGFPSVLKTLASNPIFILKHVLIEKKVIYLLHLLVPLLFLPARRWYLWAAFLPGAILTLLVTDYKPVTTFSFQYVMHWAPYMFLAMPLALVAYQREAPHGRARAHAALAAIACTVGVLSYNYGAFSARDGALKSGYQTITFSFTGEERKLYADLQEIIKSIPPEASVAASEKIGPHVSSRRVFYSLRRDSYRADYLITRPKELRLDRTKNVIANALTTGQYGVFKRVGEFVLLKRGHATQGNAALISEWRLRSTTTSTKRTSRMPRGEGDDESLEWGEPGEETLGPDADPGQDPDQEPDRSRNRGLDRDQDRVQEHDRDAD